MVLNLEHCYVDEVISLFTLWVYVRISFNQNQVDFAQR